MSNWVELEEEGQIYYLNEDVGNIIKIGESMYVSCIPKVIRLGPFGSLEEAKAAFDNKKEIDDTLTELNSKLMRK